MMSDLWNLQLMFCGAQARTIHLVYHSESAARSAADRIISKDNPVMSEFPYFQEMDHYGTEVWIFGGGPLEVVMLQECGRASEGGIELGLSQARAQAKAQERAARDPILREAQQKQNLVRAMPMPIMPPGKM